jgi:hypothetical protein
MIHGNPLVTFLAQDRPKIEKVAEKVLDYTGKVSNWCDVHIYNASFSPIQN